MSYMDGLYGWIIFGWVISGLILFFNIVWYDLLGEEYWDIYKLSKRGPISLVIYFYNLFGLVNFVCAVIGTIYIWIG